MPSSAVQTCARSEEHTSELQSHDNLVCRLLLEKKHRRPQDPRATGAATRAARPPTRRRASPPSTPSHNPWHISSDQEPPMRAPSWFFLKDGGPPEFPPLPLPAPLRS